MTTFTVGMHAEYSILTNDRKAKIAEAGEIPVGLMIHSEPGGYILSGTPTGPGDRYVLHFTATNSAGKTSQAFVLTLDQAPAFITKGYPTSIYGIMGKYDYTPIKAVGYPAPQISLQGGLPTGMKFQSFSNGTASISGTPSAFGSAGDSPITLTATNAAGTTTETMSVNVINAWDPIAVVGTVLSFL